MGVDLGGVGGEYDKNTVHKNYKELTSFFKNGRIKATIIDIMCAYMCAVYGFEYGCVYDRGEILELSSCFLLWVLGIKLGVQAYIVNVFTC